MSSGTGHAPRYAVLGIGNVLMRDDGLGPHLAARFQAGYELPENLEVADVGTPGPELYCRVVQRRGLIILDAVRSRGCPGRIHRFSRDQIVAEVAGRAASQHDPFLRGAILTAEFVGQAPDHIVLLGAEVSEVAAGPGLSTIVESSLPVLEDLLVSELARLGVHVKKRGPGHLAMTGPGEVEGASAQAELLGLQQHAHVQGAGVLRHTAE